MSLSVEWQIKSCFLCHTYNVIYLKTITFIHIQNKRHGEWLVSPLLSIFFFSQRCVIYFLEKYAFFLHLVIRSMSCRTEKTDSVLDEMLHYRNYNTESLEGIRSRLKPRIRGCLNSMQETFIQCQNTSRWQNCGR